MYTHSSSQRRSAAWPPIYDGVSVHAARPLVSAPRFFWFWVALSGKTCTLLAVIPIPTKTLCLYLNVSICSLGGACMRLFLACFGCCWVLQLMTSCFPGQIVQVPWGHLLGASCSFVVQLCAVYVFPRSWPCICWPMQLFAQGVTEADEETAAPGRCI